MTDDEPEPNNPLGPYYPSEIPQVPGTGRRWVAVILALVLLGGVVAGLLRLLATVT